MVAGADYRPLYPYPSHYAVVDGHRLHYLDEGPRDAPALLLLHGNPTWSFYYRALVDDLSREYRVVVPDHLGCGLSDKPQDYPYDLVHHIGNLESLVEQLAPPLGAPVTLGVHDWGGAIGFGYARRHPQRVQRLVIFNTAAFFLPRLPWGIRVCRWPWLGPWLVRGLNGFLRIGLHLVSAKPERLTADVKAGYLAPYDSWAHRVAIEGFVKDIPLEVNHPSRSELDAIEAQLALFAQRPMLILWGGRDFCFTDAFLAEWRRRFPEARWVRFADAGHFVVEDAHECIIPELRAFLAKP